MSDLCPTCKLLKDARYCTPNEINAYNASVGVTKVFPYRVVGDMSRMNEATCRCRFYTRDNP